MSLALLILLPFGSSLLLGMLYLFTSLRSERLYALIGVGAPLLISLIALWLGYGQLQGAESLHVSLFTWLSIDALRIEFALSFDHLSAVMMAFVSVIGTLIHLFAVGYMRGDAGFGKFFAYFNFFMGAMALLVLADNPIILFIGWELVGLASYLLIGFYHRESANVTAANKAFIANRVGDFGFIMALVLLFGAVGEGGFSFSAIEAQIYSVDHALLSLIGVLLFVGAMGKSAQIPLYVWLPDAMAGPTPVSALIHAATMVTAGVYMVARFDFLYVLIPAVGLFIAVIGILSALLSALIATMQSDIKKILAYSTMSQLGYMFVAVGLGAYGAGIFHVFTHAFFKALLFMGVGAVIIALHHEQNIFKMGGLRRFMPLVFYPMLIATLALSGVAPFAGFFSKDAILAAAVASEYPLFGVLGLVVAFLTAYYMMRLLLLVFVAPAKHRHTSLHVSPYLSLPLLPLALGSAVAGFWGMGGAYGGGDALTHFLSLSDYAHHLTHKSEYLLALLSNLIAFAGFALAYRRFASGAREPQPTALFERWILERFYVDALYHALLVVPLRRISLWCERIVDDRFVDGTLGLFSGGYRTLATHFSTLQNGNVRHYALYFLSGVSLLSLLLLWRL
ncbi:MAG: NADH-quinone oxidoreductase subunit L [Campylobacterales bacterium]|nr:NADH-quinone oxidoreductase subunit L [Campylobacterales bacterium]